MDLSGGPVLDSCEHGKEPCGFINGRVYLDHLRHYNLQKDLTEWNNYLAHNEAKKHVFTKLKPKSQSGCI